MSQTSDSPEVGCVSVDAPDIAAPEVGADALLSALNDPHRRGVIRLLGERPEPVALDELAGELTERMPETPNHGPEFYEVVTRHRREDVSMALRHVHLPKLAAVDFVEYDEVSETVRGGHDFARAAGIVDLTTAARP